MVMRNFELLDQTQRNPLKALQLGIACLVCEPADVFSASGYKQAEIMPLTY